MIDKTIYTVLCYIYSVVVLINLMAYVVRVSGYALIDHSYIPLRTTVLLIYVVDFSFNMWQCRTLVVYTKFCKCY